MRYRSTPRISSKSAPYGKALKLGFVAALVIESLISGLGTALAKELEIAQDPPSALFSGALEKLALSAPATGDVSWKVHARMVDGEILNPATGVKDKVRLRAYQGDSTNPLIPFVAPTVSLKPGNTFRLQIENELPVDDPSCTGHDDVNVPHCFNSTNMHTHGLWVSPTGNSDNVLLRVDPGVSFTYEYNIPSDHPAGTFWYHPHLHGSTALQVSSGMAGALIIEGDRLPSSTTNGDIDTLLVDEDGGAFRERVLLLQQIQYACRDSNGGIKKNAEGQWRCDPGDTGTIENYDQFGPQSWKESGRFTTINGLVTPVFDGAAAGRPERWRLIHAGVRDSVNLRFHKLLDTALNDGELPRAAGIDETAQDKFVSEVCARDPLDQFSIATDGLTREQVRQQTETSLHPGYREDLLMVFPEEGVYCVIDGEAAGNETVSADSKSRKLLGYVRVGPGETPVSDPFQHLVSLLVTAAEGYMPAEVAESVIAELNDGLKLTHFLPHESLMEATVDGSRSLGFNISSENGLSFEVGDLDQTGNLINAAPYDPDRIDRKLPLGSIEDWDLRSFLGGHPFHIHVNPFQVIEILDASGNDVSNHDPGNDSIYAGLKGAWKDTLFVTMENAGGNPVPYRIKVRTHYRRYIGEFVLHCHILDHEDKGMMQNVRIGLPDGQGGILSAHH